VVACRSSQAGQSRQPASFLFAPFCTWQRRTQTTISPARRGRMMPVGVQIDDSDHFFSFGSVRRTAGAAEPLHKRSRFASHASIFARRPAGFQSTLAATSRCTSQLCVADQTRSPSRSRCMYVCMYHHDVVCIVPSRGL